MLRTPQQLQIDQEAQKITVPPLNRLDTLRTWYHEAIDRCGDITLVALARGLLGLALAIVSGFGSWLALWEYVRAVGDSEPIFVVRLALVVGLPAGIATVILWWNRESPKRVMWLYSAITVAVATVVPIMFMLIRGVETYYALFAGTYRILVIDVSDALFNMVAASAVGANVVAAALSIYRMARYREI